MLNVAHNGSLYRQGKASTWIHSKPSVDQYIEIMLVHRRGLEGRQPLAPLQRLPSEPMQAVPSEEAALPSG